jgi:hypothetical protein
MYKIITVDESNLEKYPQVICFINPKNEFHHLKMEWIKDQFKEGLQIKQLQTEDNKIAGFIEFTLGENAWRGVKAKDYLFIHCLWVYPNENKNKGFGKALIKEVEKYAEEQKKLGVAVITSEESFMAKRDLFLKNEYEQVEEKDKFQLLVKKFKDNAENPQLRNNQETLKDYKGWNIIYSKQCPWVARFIEEIKPILEEEKINIKIKELKTAKEAQSAPSIYSTFNLIRDGKLLADRYISTTRIKNILKKEK